MKHYTAKRKSFFQSINDKNIKSCILTWLTRLSTFQRNHLQSLLSLYEEIYLERTLSQQNASVSFCINTKKCYTSSKLLFLQLSLFLVHCLVLYSNSNTPYTIIYSWPFLLQINQSPFHYLKSTRALDLASLQSHHRISALCLLKPMCIWKEK